jgi:hypothetical protein
MTAKRMLRAVGMAGVLVLSSGGSALSMHSQTTANSAPAGPGILTRDQAAAIFPANVFFRGQTATTQSRNSSGVRLADGRLVLAAIVNTSGYSSGVAEAYQAYLITEVPLNFGDRVLKPGAYGFGFVTGDRMTIMDIGGTEVLSATTVHDTELARPIPLQILPEAAKFRLYLGRNYVSFAAAPGSTRVP